MNNKSRKLVTSALAAAVAVGVYQLTLSDPTSSSKTIAVNPQVLIANQSISPATPTTLVDVQNGLERTTAGVGEFEADGFMSATGAANAQSKKPLTHETQRAPNTPAPMSRGLQAVVASGSSEDVEILLLNKEGDKSRCRHRGRSRWRNLSQL